MRRKVVQLTASHQHHLSKGERKEFSYPVLANQAGQSYSGEMVTERKSRLGLGTLVETCRGGDVGMGTDQGK